MSINFSNNTPYKDFLAQTGVYSPISGNMSVPSLGASQVASVKVGDIEPDSFDNTSRDKQNSLNPKKWIGIISASLGGTILLTVLGIAAFSKGFSGGFSKWLTKISADAKKTIFEINAKSKDLSLMQKIRLGFNKSLQLAADGLQASSNITAIKDSLSSCILNKLGMKKIVNGINKFFKKIALKTKNNTYKEAEYSVVDFCNYLKNIAKQHNNPELEQKADKIMKEYMASFSSEKHIARSNKAWEQLDGMDKKVFNALFKKKGGFFKNLKQLKSYVTSEIISKDKNALKNELRVSKSRISNNISDVNENLKQAFFDLQVSLDSSDKKIVNIIKELAKNLNESKTLKGSSEEAQRKILFGKIQAGLDDLSKIAAGMKDKKAQNQLQGNINKIHELIQPESYGKGYAQDALTEIKGMFAQGVDAAEYKTAKMYMERMNSKMNSAIKKEVASYEKLAELRVGSAPTDILGILGPATLAGIIVASSKDKDERISKTLTAGIPIIGGIGMSYYGTLRGWTGARNLCLGAISMWLLNLTGSKVDEYTKNYRLEQNKLKAAFESFTKLQKNTNT